MSQLYKKTFIVKPLVACVGLALSMQAQATYKEFSDIPLHLVNKSTISTAANIKPNVVLQIDDSGSMEWTISGQETTVESEKRINIARPAFLEVIQKYADTVNMRIITLNSNSMRWKLPVYEKVYHPAFGRVVQTNKILYYKNPNAYEDYVQFPRDDQAGIYPTYVHNKLFMDGKQPFAQSKQDLLSYAQNMLVYGATPSTSRYIDSIALLDKALEYRCQQSYIIAFSDGEPNDHGHILANGYSNFYERNIPGLATSGNHLKNDGKNNYTFKPNQNSRTWNMNIWFAKDPRYGFKLPLLDKYKPTSWHKFTSTDVHQRDKRTGIYPQVNSIMENRDGEGYTVINFNSPAIATWFAQSVYDNDLRQGGRDAAGKSWDDPEFLGGKQNIVTYTIGFGLQAPYLDSLSTGHAGAFSAMNRGELNSALEEIFKSITNNIPSNHVGESFSNIAPTFNTDENANTSVNSVGTIRLDLQNGSSEVRFYDLDKTSKTFNKNSYKIPSYNNRKVLMHLGEANNKVYWQDYLPRWVNNQFFGINSPNANEWRDSLLPWITRSGNDNDIAARPNNSLKYRIRPEDKRKMGDVLNAPLEAFGPFEYGRQKYLVTAANDGMVYLFQSQDSQTNPYDLKLNYMPVAMQRSNVQDTVAKNLKNIVDPNYIQDPTKKHQYLINGGFNIRKMDKRSGKGQPIFMVGNMGQGGRGSYAINIGGKERDNVNQPVGIDAPESQWTTSVPLFETPKDGALGYTIGTPQIGRLSNSRSAKFAIDAKNTNTVNVTTSLQDVSYAAFINNGVNNPNNQETALYVYNIFDKLNVGLDSSVKSTKTAGQLLQKINVGNTGGLAQATLVDTNLDGVIDVAYAGDVQGGLYRFDFRKGGPGFWTGHKIFQADAKQPITSAPAIHRIKKDEYVVIFGTGSDLYAEDLDNKDQQSVYGVYDNLAIDQPQEKTRSDLMQQTLQDGGEKETANGKKVKVRKLSDNPLNGKSGWYFDLKLSVGERVVIKPEILLKTAVITTRTYTTQRNQITNANNDKCVREEASIKSDSESWIMQVRADNGGQLPINPDPTKGITDPSVYAYLDFFGENKDKNHKFRPTEMIAAYREVGNINLKLLFGLGTNENKVGHIGNSCTADGDCGNAGGTGGTGGGGTDIELNENPDDKRQECINGIKDLAAYGSGSKDGLSSPIAIYGKQCSSGGLRRLGWREIF